MRQASGIFGGHPIDTLPIETYHRILSAIHERVCTELLTFLSHLLLRYFRSLLER